MGHQQTENRERRRKPDAAAKRYDVCRAAQVPLLPALKKPHGVYRRFHSRIDGRPVVVLISLAPTRNPKIGNMIQSAIMREDVLPHLAQKTGDDYSVCGDCKLRPHLAQQLSGAQRKPRCYVLTHQFPTSQWKSFTRGGYEELSFRRHKKWLRGLHRLGSYGDPTAVPAAFWQKLLSFSRGHTGYTHQWNKGCNQHYRSFLMASVDNEEEAKLARSMGWRYFRTRYADEALRADEFMCPASIEAGHERQCADCLACKGNPHGTARTVCPVVILHGSINGNLPQKNAA